MSVVGRRLTGINRKAEPLRLIFDTSLTSSNTVVVPLSGSREITINWGDGTFTSDVASSGRMFYEHTYSQSGEYVVDVSGQCEEFGTGFDSPSVSRDNLVACETFGDLGFTSFFGAFRDCKNLTSVPLSVPPTVNITWVMFQLCESFNQDISSWNTSNIENMAAMFSRSGFNSNIGNWDVSNVTNMGFMFTETLFNQPIGSWDVSNVGNMRGMFKNNSAFNQDIGGWQISPTGFGDEGELVLIEMFQNASSFNQDLSGWCVPLITSEPTDFATGSALAPANYPVWGTCP